MAALPCTPINPAPRCAREGDPMSIEVQPIERLLVTPRQAAEMLSISQRSLENLRVSGVLRSVKVRNSRRYSVDDLRRLAEAAV